MEERVFPHLQFLYNFCHKGLLLWSLPIPAHSYFYGVHPFPHTLTSMESTHSRTLLLLWSLPIPTHSYFYGVHPFPHTLTSMESTHSHTLLLLWSLPIPTHSYFYGVYPFPHTLTSMESTHSRTLLLLWSLPIPAHSYFYGVHPFPHTHEGALVGTVVQQKHAVRPPEVRLGNTSEPCKKKFKELLIHKKAMHT